MESMDALTGKPSRRALAFSCFVLGVGMLFPWNALLNDNSLPEKTFANVQQIFPICYLTLNCLTTVAITLVTWSQTVNKVLSRLAFGIFLTAFVTFLSLTMIADVNKSLYSFIVLVFSALVGSATSIIQINVVAQVSQTHHKNITLILLGQAIAGIVPPIVQVILQLAAGGPESERIRDRCFYGVSIFVVGLCIPLYLALPTVIKKVKHIAELALPADSLTVSEEEKKCNSSDNSVKDANPVMRVFIAFSPFIISMFSNFCLTFVVFPSITLHIRGATDENSIGIFISVTFLAFALGDLFGRMLPAALGPVFKYMSHRMKCSDSSPKSRATRNRVHRITLVALTTLRWLFVPLFLLFPVNGKKDGIPSIFNATYFGPFTIFVLGLSCGAIATDCFASISSATIKSEDGETRELTDVEKSICGRLLTFALLFGLFVGFLIAIPFEILWKIKP